MKWSLNHAYTRGFEAFMLDKSDWNDYLQMNINCTI